MEKNPWSKVSTFWTKQSQDIANKCAQKGRIYNAYCVRKGSFKGYDENRNWEPIYYEHSFTYIRFADAQGLEHEYIEEHDTHKVLADHILR